MASSKRSFSNFRDSNEFPFSIENGNIIYPNLYSKINNSDRFRFWNIYAELKKNNTKMNIENEFIDIDYFKEFEKTNKGLKIYIYTEYGVMKGKTTLSEPTIIDIGKNLNKKNETSIITQSLIHMRNLYLKRIKSGYMLDLNKTDNNIYPMALHEYKKFKRYVKYPCYIQPKLDGIRITATINQETDDVKLLSRRLNDIYGFDNIKNEVNEILKDNKNLILDGEFYNHDMNLQQISGIVRHQDVDYELKNQLYFYIFDCIDLENNLTFNERYNMLISLFKKTKHLKFLILTETILTNNEKESDILYNSFISKKYEGIIYKNLDATYEYSNIKEIRSYQFLKRKLQHTDEYQIVGFEQGIKGKDVGAIIFIMKTPNGHEFKSVPNMTLDDRKTMYNLAKQKFDKLFKNKMATISFDDYSKDNIPLRSKFITIRDYE